jgi:putative addiction module CopG family antidote
MNVSISEEWQCFIEAQVKSGEFGNASEVIRTALRHWREERERQALAEFTAVWPQTGAPGEPTDDDNTRISAMVRAHRKSAKSRR